MGTAMSDKKKSSEEDDSGKIFRLVDLLVNRVDIVDRGANRRKWLIRKQENAMPGKEGKEVFEGADGNLTTEEPEVNNDEDRKETAKADSIPGPVKTKVLSMVEEVSNRLSSLIAQVKGANETDEKLQNPIPSSVGNEIKAQASMLRGVLSRYPSPASRATMSTEKQLTIPKPVKEKLMSVLEGVSNRLASVIAKVKEATATNEELPNPIPEGMGKEIISLADMLEGLLEKYPSAQAGSQKSGEVNPVRDALWHLSDSLNKLEPGKAVDEAVFKSLQKSRDLLAATQQETAKEGEQPKGEEVQKKGAPMNQERLTQFSKAIKILRKLLESMIPEEGKGTWPTQKATKIEVAKSAEKKKTVDIGNKVSDAETKLAKAEARLAEVNREISKQLNRTAPSNVAWVDSTPSGADDDSAASNDEKWPDDFNSPNELD